MAESDAFMTGIELLAAYICNREVDLPDRPDDLVDLLRNELCLARDKRILATKKRDVWKLLKTGDSPISCDGGVGIYGGEKDFKRRGDKPRFVRNDGAWFHFTITVDMRDRRPLALIAYDFELVFPEKLVKEHQFPLFVRFDLNQPGHRNDCRELRAHMHPGHDDLITPAPLMAPLEILRLFLYGGLVPPAKLRNPRGAATDSMEPIS